MFDDGGVQVDREHGEVHGQRTASGHCQHQDSEIFRIVRGLPWRRVVAARFAAADAQAQLAA
jgi:hypothetical protein